MDLIKNGAKSALGVDQGLSVDAQIGDRENDLTVKTGDENQVEVQKLEGGINYIDEGPSFPLILLLILGWILPDPVRIWDGIKLLPSWLRRK